MTRDVGSVPEHCLPVQGPGPSLSGSWCLICDWGRVQTPLERGLKCAD